MGNFCLETKYYICNLLFSGKIFLSVRFNIQHIIFTNTNTNNNGSNKINPNKHAKGLKKSKHFLNKEKCGNKVDMVAIIVLFPF